MPKLPISRAPCQAENTPNQETALPLTQHDWRCVQYSNQLYVVGINLPKKETNKTTSITFSRPPRFRRYRHDEPLIKNRRKNYSTVVITDRYLEITKALRTAKTMGARISSIIVKQVVSIFEIPSTVLTDKRPQLISNFFAALWKGLGVKTVTSTE